MSKRHAHSWKGTCMGIKAGPHCNHSIMSYIISINIYYYKYILCIFIIKAISAIKVNKHTSLTATVTKSTNSAVTVVSEPYWGQVEAMAHNIVLQAYEHSLQAYGHKIPYNVPLREIPKIIEQIRKVQENHQQLENSCAKVTNGHREYSACLKKNSAVMHNREENHEKQKDKKFCNN